MAPLRAAVLGTGFSASIFQIPFIKALQAGKHVILEKPIVTTAAEARDLIDIAKAKGVTLAPYHNRRFDGDFLTVEKLIKENKLSDLSDFESRYDVSANWGLGEPGGSAGILYGLGSHLIDQTVALFGKPSSVYAILANGRRVGHPDVDDSYIVHLRYPDNPVIVTLRSALHSTTTKQIRYIVRGPKSSYVKYGLDVQGKPQAIGGQEPLSPGFGEEPESSWGEYAYLDQSGKRHAESIRTETGSYLGYYRNVAEAITGKSTLVVTAEQAEVGIQIIEAAKKSHETDTVVKL
ncbi:hypothetical protein FRB97_003180 [Tulasnella sp. 331]|nr:hypothetical protein FRB97_003180 [Tulasnella sp. 331]